MSRFAKFEARVISLKHSLNPLNFGKKPANVAATTAGQTEVKQTMRKRFGLYMKTVAYDYKDVGIDTLKTMRDKPMKASFYLITGGTLYTAYRMNPTELNYQNCLVEHSLDLMMCGEGVRNQKCEAYLNDINKLANHDLLTHKSYVLFSLVKRNSYNHDCDLYEKHCKPLNKPSPWNVLNYFNLFLSSLSSIVDIGLFDYWIFLNKNLTDYDVNDNEWLNKN